MNTKAPPTPAPSLRLPRSFIRLLDSLALAFGLPFVPIKADVRRSSDGPTFSFPYYGTTKIRPGKKKPTISTSLC